MKSIILCTAFLLLISCCTFGENSNNPNKNVGDSKVKSTSGDLTKDVIEVNFRDQHLKRSYVVTLSCSDRLVSKSCKYGLLKFWVLSPLHRQRTAAMFQYFQDFQTFLYCPMHSKVEGGDVSDLITILRSNFDKRGTT